MTKQEKEELRVNCDSVKATINNLRSKVTMNDKNSVPLDGALYFIFLMIDNLLEDDFDKHLCKANNLINIIEKL